MNQTPSTTPPPKPDATILEGRWLHYVMVAIARTDHLSFLAGGLGLLAILTLHARLWQAVTAKLAGRASDILTGAALLDLILLWLLPRRRISFGPINSQFVMLFIPRLLASLFSWLLAWWQPAVGLGTTIVLQLLGTATYLRGMLYEPHQLGLTHLKLTSPHLPAAAPPIRLLHLSDLHLERLTDREDHLLALIDEIEPDLIVITGDFLNLSYARDPEAIRQVRAFLPKINAPYGVYATLGSPPVDVPDVAPNHFLDNHIQLLREDVLDLDLDHGRRLTLIGMDCTHDLIYDEHLFSQLDQRRNDRNATVFLYHSPELMPVVQTHEVDLYLCGHTHGGQVRLPFYGAVLTSSALGKRYEMGRYDENGTTLYISRGIGLEGLSAPRLRLFCPPEIILVTLTGEN